METVDIPKEILDKKLSSKEGTPFSITMIKVEEQRLTFLVGGSKSIKCHSVDAMEAIVLLLATYYVFDLNYPAMYGQVLGFLQEKLLLQPYAFFKGTNFQKFTHKLKSKNQNKMED